MASSYKESSYENSIIELFKKMNYNHIYGPNLNREYENPLYEEEVIKALERINPMLPKSALVEALNKIKNIENGSLVQQNEVFMDYLQNGIPVRYLLNGEERIDIAYIVDYENIENNSFHIINQWEFKENKLTKSIRPDLIIFLNGFPIVVIELKSPSREETDASDGYLQIRNYLQEGTSLFIYNAICVMSDLLTSKAGTITSGEDRFMAWKTIDGNYENTDAAGFDTFFIGMFMKDRILDIIKNFICFNNDGKNTFKILAGYHQYFAVKKAIESTKKAAKRDGNGKGGVFWHTQGSGKSLSMVFYAHLLQKALNSPTIVVVTDRNDLDNQLFSQFSRCEKFLRQTPIQAQSREHLKEILNGRKANGIFFTTMQKFEELDEPMSERKNIVVMADEAHRGQYGLAETFKTVMDDETGEERVQLVKGTARIIRDNLPNATYIGFTGTPISEKDRSTKEVFGDYIDIYDMTQAVEDGATKPVYYESRVISLKFDENILKQIDDEYDRLSTKTSEHNIEKSKRTLGKMDAILGNDETIESLVTDILNHYENNRKDLLTGKAMIVAYSREIAMKIYYKMLEMRPEYEGKLKVVMTENNQDPEEWRKIIGNKKYRDELGKQFKDDESQLKIVIVVDMWLTGFDVPSLATMYVYKPMKGHNLMQAIARVNRVYKEKEGGLIVDYVGIARQLKEAMKDYTVRDRKKYGNTDISKVAYPKFVEKLQICRDLFYGYDYSKFLQGTDLERTQVLKEGLNFMLSPSKQKEKEYFIKESLLLKQSLSLCSSIVEEKLRYEAGFFEAIRVLLMRFIKEGAEKEMSLKELNSRINSLLEHSIKSEGVINLFSDVNEEFSIFDPKFLKDISKMKEKNLAVEILRKIIAGQVQIYKKTNVVKSKKFSQIMQEAMNKYLNGLLTNEEVIEEMMNLARDIKAMQEEGNNLGLTDEELAFYDALTKPRAVKDAYSNEALIAITKELTEALRKNRTIDWQKKNTARAKMKVIIKRLLKKYKYPPDGEDDAMDNVMTQCELWADNTNYSNVSNSEYMVAEN